MLGTTQEDVVGHPGPVTTICAVSGSKLLPFTVSENERVLAKIAVGKILLVLGAATPLAVSVCPLDSAAPGPFCTWMVKEPALLMVTGPMI